MRLVKVGRIVEDGRYRGYELDPDAYLGRISEFEGDLPPGARAFATDSAHYDFFGPRCVKDLGYESMTAATDGELVITFTPNEWKHEVGLRLDYEGVVSQNFVPNDDSADFGTILLDEVLPMPGGVCHEIALTGGTLTVVAEDLRATWG